MRYYPAFLDLRGKRCAVIGGGKVAERKVRSLLEAGAKVYVASPELTPTLARMAHQGRIAYKRGPYEQLDLDGVFLVIAATDRPFTQKQVAVDAARRNILSNVVDAPEASSLIVPASFARGDLQIAISTGGASPALAQQLRQRLEKQFGLEYAAFLKWMQAARKRLQRRVGSAELRAEILHRLAGSGILRLLRSGHRKRARQQLERILEQARRAGHRRRAATRKRTQRVGLRRARKSGKAR